MDSKCAACKDSPCCSIITIPVASPRSRKDYDLLMFYVVHKDVELLKRGNNWLVLIRSTCEHLTEDGLCGIYDDRPRSCRVYPNVGCEIDIPIENKYERHFRTRQDLLEFMKEQNQ